MTRDSRRRGLLCIWRALAILALAAILSADIDAEGIGAEGVSADEASSIIGPEVYGALLSYGKVVRTGSSPSLIPRHAAGSTLRDRLDAEKGPSGSPVIVEAVFALRRQRPASASGRAAELAAIYGIMSSFSSLEGIQYYSASEKGMRTLYSQSYRIDSVDSRRRLPDPRSPDPESLPSGESFLVLQKDARFGANLYRYSFASYPDAVFVDATNLTGLNYGPIPMVAPGKLGTRLIVIAAEDAIVFYTESSAEAPGIFKSKVGESFSNRGEALFLWFSSRYEAHYKAK